MTLIPTPSAPTDRPEEKTFALPAYWAGLIGTVMAGGLFPAVIAAFDLFLGQSFGLPVGPGFVVGGMPMGLLFAAIAAAIIFPLTALTQRLTGLDRFAVELIALAGGWSGFAATAFLLEGLVARNLPPAPRYL